MRNHFGSALLIIACMAIFPSVHLSAQSDPAASLDKTGTGVITGKIMLKEGGPLAGGRVFFFNTATGVAPFYDQFRRLPDISGKIGADGKFTVELLAGKYYIRAWKMLSGVGAGLQDGDYVFSSLDDKGKPKEYTIKRGEILDIGIISEAVPYKKVQQIIKTAIEGVIKDSDGTPVEGAVVFAFTDQALANKPLFFSKRTGKDGVYLLGVQAGTYYLRVRDKLRGGPLQPGQIVGIFGEKVPAPVTVKDGEIKSGIDIKVIKFLGRGPLLGTSPGGPKQQ